MYSCKKFLIVAKMAKTVYETDNCSGTSDLLSSLLSNLMSSIARVDIDCNCEFGMLILLLGQVCLGI